MPRIDELRLIARVARMYYEQDMRQSGIAKQLGLSQATVSRLLNRSREEGIIRISVNLPNGVYTELEENLVKKFGLRDVIVVDSLDNNEKLIQRDLGTAAAYYLESAIRPNEVIGISSWSATLVALVDALHSVPRKPGVKVVQILGGVGNPAAESYAIHLTSRMAQLVNGEAVYLPVSGVLTTEAARDILAADEVALKAIRLFDHVTTALVGIGAVEPSPLLAESGNIFAPQELDLLRQEKAVGDILLRYFDHDGNLSKTGLEKRVISMSLEQLSKVSRAIGVAGGSRKYAAILGALRGHWINILVTDHFTADRLANE
ncbi:MAG: sugar-binding transcriptional regulator [Anaerolineae bacterium]|nr:sugar-binding transcriptional regulator [Anaerolineae bacterium]MBL6962048.1 sugar-binding transcriptional regulator [Anaerolineales bacterium]